MLIFAILTGLDDLIKLSDWGGDGTYKVCPSNYYQLYRVHIRKDNFSVPHVFALLPNKQETAYDQLFSQLVALRPNIQPKRYMMDFEKPL